MKVPQQMLGGLKLFWKWGDENDQRLGSKGICKQAFSGSAGRKWPVIDVHDARIQSDKTVGQVFFPALFDIKFQVSRKRWIICVFL